ncbi:hypothetical protein [Chlorobium sp.]|uniref:hypothetical protein n=1 Tax=Chlorobium sp. TaxID=1095 RepID=UPI003C43B73C
MTANHRFHPTSLPQLRVVSAKGEPGRSLALETMKSDFYFGQMLFHLTYAGRENQLLCCATPRQKEYVARFLAHVIEWYPAELEAGIAADEALLAYALWSEASA